MRCLLGFVAIAMGSLVAQSQTPAAPAPPPTIHNSTAVPPAPVKAGDDRTEAGEFPLDTPADQPARDVTPATSPVPSAASRGYLMPGTVLRVRIDRQVVSGSVRNGDSFSGLLLDAVETAKGQTLARGTPVEATVVSSSPAGTMDSYGILTVQVYRVGGVGVYSNVLEFDGQEGAKVQADSAPAKGTEAQIASGAVLRFEVLGAGDEPDDSVRPKGGREAGQRTGAAGGARPAAADATAAPQATTPGPGMTTPH